MIAAVHPCPKATTQVVVPMAERFAPALRYSKLLVICSGPVAGVAGGTFHVVLRREGGRWRIVTADSSISVTRKP